MRRVLFSGWFAFLPCLVVVLAACPARADNPEGKKVKVTYHEDGKEVEKPFDLNDKAQMDELVDRLKKGEVEHLVQDKPPALLNLRWDLGLWTLVVFIALFLILKKWAWGPMLEGLQRREDNIRNAAEEAKRAREEMARMQADFEKKMAQAYQEIPQIMEEARRDANNLMEEMRAKAQAEIQADRQRLRREIEMARDQALHDLWNQSAQLATLISAKAIRGQLAPEHHRRLVDEALAELRGAGDERQREVASV